MRDCTVIPSDPPRQNTFLEQLRIKQLMRDNESLKKEMNTLISEQTKAEPLDGGHANAWCSQPQNRQTLDLRPQGNSPMDPRTSFNGHSVAGCNNNRSDGIIVNECTDRQGMAAPDMGADRNAVLVEQLMGKDNGNSIGFWNKGLEEYHIA